MNLGIDDIKKVLISNRLLAGNIAGVLILKGLGLILSLFSMPLYIDYFHNQSVLGVWFTVLSVVNWIISFDLGVGNGVRNNLTIAISQNDRTRMRQVISSGYFILGLVTIVLLAVVLAVSTYVEWNAFFNVSEDVIPAESLRKAVVITLCGLFFSFFLRLITSVNSAIQYPAINNVVTFITSLLLIVWLLVSPSMDDPVENMMRMALAYCFIVNIPLLVTTIITFSLSILDGCYPSIRFIERNAAKGVIQVGMLFFILQLLFMVINVTNEWFVSKFFSPDDVVVYQIYNRLFQVMTTIFMLILLPIVAAITKAYAEGRIGWINKVKRVLYIFTAAVSVIQILLAVCLQPIVNIWLMDRAITVNYTVAAVFVFTSITGIWVSVQSAIVTGLNKLNLQLVFFLIAVPVKIALILMGCRYSMSWVIVVLSTGLCLLPYGIVQPFAIEKLLKDVPTDK